MDFNRHDIEAEYNRLGHVLGWSFLTCPARNIEAATVALITVNPGGANFQSPVWSVEAGSAYVIERWKDCPAGEEKLQRQVRGMFRLMNVNPEDVLSGYLVPFRSPCWAALPRRLESLRFGITLWRAVLQKANAETVVAFGREIGQHVVDLLGASSQARYPAAWGELTIDAYRFGAGRRLIVLPHLSRFALFGRLQSEVAFRAALTS
jgi:hypothetical protein